MEEKRKNNDSAANKAETILVVEDDEGLLRLIQKNLQRAGLQTEGVLNGAEAIDWVFSNPQALLLLDYRLPDMTGEQVIRTLAERQCNVPFVVNTGHGDQKVAVEMMKLGARDYLVKDVAFLELLPSVVKQVLEQLATEKELVVAQEALGESEEKNRALVDAAGKTGLGIIILQDTKGGEGAIIFANDVIATVLGYSSEEMLAKTFWDFLAPATVPALQDRYRRRQGGEDVPSHYELTLVHRDGTMVCVDIGASTMTYRGKAAEVAYLRDITERKRADDLLQMRIEERTAELAKTSEELQTAIDERKQAEEKL